MGVKAPVRQSGDTVGSGVAVGAGVVVGFVVGFIVGAVILTLIMLKRFNFPREKKIPKVMFNIINGGMHAKNNLDIQEFMIVPKKETFRETLRCASEVFHSLKELLEKEGYNTSVGDEGGFAPNLETNTEGFELIMEAIKKAGYKPQDIDCVFAGDLLNQCIGSYFGLRAKGIPLIGLYGACSTMAESLLIGSMLVGGDFYDCVEDFANDKYDELFLGDINSENSGKISKIIAELAFRHTTTPRLPNLTSADKMISYISWFFDVNYQYSIDYCKPNH